MAGAALAASVMLGAPAVSHATALGYGELEGTWDLNHPSTFANPSASNVTLDYAQLTNLPVGMVSAAIQGTGMHTKTAPNEPTLLGQIAWDGSTATSERVILRAAVVNRQVVERNHYVHIQDEGGVRSGFLARVVTGQRPLRRPPNSGKPAVGKDAHATVSGSAGVRLGRPGPRAARSPGFR